MHNDNDFSDSQPHQGERRRERAGRGAPGNEGRGGHEPICFPAGKGPGHGGGGQGVGGQGGGQGGGRGEGGGRGQGGQGRGPGPHGPAEGGGRGGGGGRGRARRGDIRTATLLLLAEEPMHGYQVMQAIAERTDGSWCPSPGAVYPTIAQLEDEGLITITRVSGRKLATLTEDGQQHMADNSSTMGDPFVSMTGGATGRRDLRRAIDEVQTATRAVAKSGNDGQIAAVHQVLAETRKSIYLVLADESATTAIEDPLSDEP